MPKTYKLFKQVLFDGAPFWTNGIVWEIVKENGEPVKNKDKNIADKLKKDAEKDNPEYKYKLKEVEE